MALVTRIGETSAQTDMTAVRLPNPASTIRRLPIFWRVFALDAALLVTATLLLAFSPITISAPIERNQAIVLVLGLLVFLAANWFLLRVSLRPLRNLAELMRDVDLREPGKRLSIESAGEVSAVIGTFNATLSRLEQERRESSTIAFRAQEEERRRIARDLHDEIGQNLTGVLLFLGRAEETSGPEHAEAIEAAQETARLALDELRRVDRLLRPSVLQDLGLAAALHALCDLFCARTGRAVDASVDESIELDPSTALAVYRIAQEALTNVSRHTDAEHVSLDLSRSEDAQRLVLRVADDGDGIAGSDGGGMRGMRERAMIVSGQLRVDSQPGRGTSITLEAPLPALGEA